MSARVLCLGNPYRRDDGAGPAVAARLRAQGVPAHVLERDATTLLDAWDDRDVVVVDAVLSGAAPGTVHHYAPGQAVPFEAWRQVSTHGQGLAEAVGLAEALGQTPRSLEVWGIEAGDAGHGDGLSPAVAAAVEQVAEAIREATPDA